MQAVSKTVIGLGVLALGSAAWLMPGTRGDVLRLVHVPSEQLTGQYGGHDVVHALQEIIETSADIEGIAEAGSIAHDRAFEAILARAELSPLGKLQWRRAWELAATPEAQADVIARILNGTR